MRLRILVVFCLIVVSTRSLGQTAQVTQIYLCGNAGLRTILNADDPILVGNITLLETTLDSLGFQLLKDKVIYVPFASGKTYYFHSAGGGNFTSSWLVSCTEQEFWLNATRFGTLKYRHYFLDDKAGLKLLEERR